MSDLLQETKNSLERMQAFDVQTLPRRESLGHALAFVDAVEPAQKAVRLFQQIPISYIDDIPERFLVEIKGAANSIYSVFREILEFDPVAEDGNNARRTSIIGSLNSNYDNVFGQIFPIVSYLSSRSRDLGALERESRAVFQSVSDRAEHLKREMEEYNSQANSILSDIRNIAAEQGVSQQAIYFKNESDKHEMSADKWRNATIVSSTILIISAFFSLFVHKITLIAPSNTYEYIQLGISKVIIFAIMAYIVTLSARNFLSNKHNATVNKHRQNALLTFNSLVGASASEERRDIVLTYAAACIFSPQETGYIKASSNVDVPAMKLIEILPKAGGSSGGT